MTDYQVSVVVASALKGNCFSKAAISPSEIAKCVRSTGAASGLFRSRFRSQSLIATRSSRNAALTNASKKLVALLGVEPRPALHCGRDQIDAPHICVPFEKRIGQTKHKKRKYENMQ